MKLPNKFIFAALLVFPPAIFGLIVTAVHKSGQIYPGYSYSVVSDSANGGNSRIISSTINEDKLCVAFELRKGYEFPYAVISLSPEEASTVDLSRYNEIEVMISAKNNRRLPFRILTELKGVTKPGEVNSYLYLTHEIEVNPEQQVYSLRLKDFTIPDWWYTINEITPSAVKNTHDISKTAIVSITSDPGMKLGEEGEICLESIIFKKNLLIKLLPYWPVGFSYYLLIIGLLVYGIRIRRLLNEKTKYVPIEPVEVNQRDDKTDLTNYLATAYKNEDLSLEVVATEVGIPPNYVSKILKEEYGLTFKQYLNHLRVANARKLLKETNLNISEIAYESGYGNVKHFNRIFKNSEGVSPGDYRKKV